MPSIRVITVIALAAVALAAPIPRASSRAFDDASPRLNARGFYSPSAPNEPADAENYPERLKRTPVPLTAAQCASLPASLAKLLGCPIKPPVPCAENDPKFPVDQLTSAGCINPASVEVATPDEREYGRYW